MKYVLNVSTRNDPYIFYDLQMCGDSVTEESITFKCYELNRLINKLETQLNDALRAVIEEKAKST